MKAQIEVQEFEIDAQVNWKHYYGLFMQAHKFSYKRRFRAAMKQLRREAALERHCEALQRKVDTARQLINVITYLKTGPSKETVDAAREWMSDYIIVDSEIPF